MKDNYVFTYIGWLGFCISLVVIIFFEKCNGTTYAPENTIIKEKTYIYDSTKKIIIPKEKPTTVSFFTVPVPANVDTQAILKKYFSVFTYSQTFEDSLIKAEIIDTISQNKIIGRQFTRQFLKPIKTIESTTITITKSNNGFYLGAFVLGNKNNLMAGPQINYLRNKSIFNAGFDLVNKNIQLGFSYKLNAAHRN